MENINNKKVLFIANHRKDRAPSQRFRFEQYIDFLNEQGYDCHLSNLFSKSDDKIFYSKGHFIAKGFIFVKTFIKRYFELKNASQYDIVFVSREAHKIGSSVLEKIILKSKAKFIYDFDDAIWKKDMSKANQWFSWLKNPNKTKDIIAMADVVIAGNQYLKDYAYEFNKNVVIIPTTIDTVFYKSKEKKTTNKICIGWSGSTTTIKHFELAIPFLKKIKDLYQDKIIIKVIGDKNYFNKALDIKGKGWILEKEIEELATFDIGIMPLEADEWSKGKCGLKGLQYMALEIPTIMSPVGVNKEIIQNGINGFLAKTETEWINSIKELIENENLRLKIGKAGRATVIDKYSVEAQKENYLSVFNSLFNK